MNSILEIDEKNLQVITEPGVITEVLQDSVKEKGLFYPPIRPAAAPVLLAEIFLKIVVVRRP